VFINPELWNQVRPLLLKAVEGLVITGLLGVAMWPARKVKKEWSELKKGIETANEELTQQRTNCLSTLQRQGETQIALLGKMASTLDGVRIDLAEQTGYLRASVTPVRRRTAKK
jgi:hypothetical protein